MTNVKRWAHIENGLVSNVSLWDGTTQWEPGCELIELPDDSPVGPGWRRNGKKWLEPELTAEQIAMQEAAQAAADEAAARQAAKASALAKLQALGLTEAEAAAIAGL